jgi:hypothetical protein
MSNQINQKAAEIREIGANIKAALGGDGEIDVQLLKKAALIGGTVLILLWLISKIFSKSSQEALPAKKRKKRKDSMLYDMIKQQIGILLLAIFRKQILKLLKEHKIIDEKEDL